MQMHIYLHNLPIKNNQHVGTCKLCQYPSKFLLKSYSPHFGWFKFPTLKKHSLRWKTLFSFKWSLGLPGVPWIHPIGRSDPHTANRWVASIDCLGDFFWGDENAHKVGPKTSYTWGEIYIYNSFRLVGWNNPSYKTHVFSAMYRG